MNMPTNIRSNSVAFMILALVTNASALSGDGSTDIELQQAQMLQKARLLKAGVGAEAWPKGKFWSVGPTAQAMGPSAESPNEPPSSSVYPYGSSGTGGAFAKRKVHLTSHGPNPNAPTEVTADELELLTATAAKVVKDPGKRSEYVERQKKATLAARQKISLGTLLSEVTVCENAETAQELLIISCLNNSLPSETQAKLCSSESRFDGVGDIAFLSGGTMRFIRNNVFVEVRGYGCFGVEVESVAKRIDSALTKGQMSKAEFDARKPKCSLNLSGTADKEGRRFFDISSQVPEGHKVVYENMSVAGRDVGRAEGKFYFDKDIKKEKVSVTVITDELLGCTIEQEVSAD